MRQAVIFLNGRYDLRKAGFYRELALSSEAYVVAADGACDSLLKLGLVPDLIIGDMDSASEHSLSQFGRSEQVQLPAQKDWTDGELAIRTCIERGYQRLTLVGGIDDRFETDHLLANVFSLQLARDLARQAKLKDFGIVMRDPGQSIYLLEDQKLNLHGEKGDIVSILPLDADVTISYQGFVYPQGRTKLTSGLGQTLTLRNQFKGREAVLTIIGKALVIHHES